MINPYFQREGKRKKEREKGEAVTTLISLLWLMRCKIANAANCKGNHKAVIKKHEVGKSRRKVSFELALKELVDRTRSDRTRSERTHSERTEFGVRLIHYSHL